MKISDTETSKNEFIKLDNSILNWQWYKDENTKTLFIHCLLKADYKTGEFTTTFLKLANETGLSIQSVRTALKHLELTEEIKITNLFKRGSLITINNYEMYK